MKRRCDEHDYTQRGIYMITIATEGRLPLFGTLKGDPLATDGNNKPHIVLSPLGERVQACWYDIHGHYPEVSVIKLCIMPDHIHGVLFIKEKHTVPPWHYHQWLQEWYEKGGTRTGNYHGDSVAIYSTCPHRPVH